MICKECKDKPVVRGVKTINCKICGCGAFVNYGYQEICEECSDEKLICQYCGKEIKKETSFYHVSWLEDAVIKFKNQNEVVHVVRGDMSIGQFIKQWCNEDLDKIIEVK